MGLMCFCYSDILHPNRPNISKEELREKLGGMYKAQKDQISVFGLRTQFGGGKTSGFALVYDSPEAMKKFEPNYRLVRVGLATKVERASRQQRTLMPFLRVNQHDLTPSQASSARTDKRPSEVRQRSRVPRRRRRNKRHVNDYNKNGYVVDVYPGGVAGFCGSSGGGYVVLCTMRMLTQIIRECVHFLDTRDLSMELWTRQWGGLALNRLSSSDTLA